MYAIRFHCLICLTENCQSFQKCRKQQSYILPPGISQIYIYCSNKLSEPQPNLNTETPSKWFFHAFNNSHPQAVNNPITTSTPITCAVWSWPPGNVFVRVRATGVVCSVEEYRQLTLSTKSCDKVCVAVHGGSQATILTDWRTDSGTLCWPVIRDTVYWAWFPGFGGLWGPETRNGFLELHSLCLLVNWIEVNF